MMKPKLVTAAVQDLLPSKDNPRIVTDDEADLDSDGLLTSVKALGVIQPVQGRDHPDRKGKKEILAGERRWKCSVIAGHKTILCLDYGRMADDEAFKITCIENAHRRDLRPLEQGRAAAIALARCKGDVQAAAALLGQTPRWIAMGARIHEGLADVWRLGLQQEPRLRGWTAGHVALIARFPVCVQEDLYNSLVKRGWRADDISVEELAAQTADILRCLAKAPFDTAGCAECPKRSGHQHLLWSDEEAEATGKNERCLDAACWRKKETAAYQAAFAEKAREHKGLVVVDLSKQQEYQRTEELKRVYGEHLLEQEYYGRPMYEMVKAETKGAIPALVVAGAGKGSVKYIRRVKAGGSTAVPRKSKAESQAIRERGLIRARRIDLIRLRLAPVTVDSLLGDDDLFSGVLFCLALFGGADELWGSERDQFLHTWETAASPQARRRAVCDRIWLTVAASLKDGPLNDDAYADEAEIDESLDHIVRAFGWDTAALHAEAGAQVKRDRAIAEKTEIVKIENLPKSSKASCELKVYEKDGRWYGGLHAEIPKATMDLPITTDGDVYESRVLAVRSMVEQAVKWLTGQKVKKACPAALFKTFATALAEVEGACELELARKGQTEESPAAVDESRVTGHDSRARPSGLIDNPEKIRVPMEKAWQAAVTIKIGQVNQLWYVGWDAHVPGAGETMPCSDAHQGYHLRNDALSLANERLAAWLAGKPGRKGYKHHGAIREAIAKAVQAAATPTGGACSSDPATCGIGCVPCGGDKAGPPLRSAPPRSGASAKSIASGRITAGLESRERTGAEDRAGPPAVDPPYVLPVTFPASYEASCTIRVQRIEAKWYGGFEFEALGAPRVITPSPVLSRDRPYETKAACLTGMQAEIRNRLMVCAGTNRKLKSRAVQIAVCVEEAVEEELTKPTCRICGCTPDNCSGCVERTGVPCHWVEADLCSACAEGTHQ